MYIPEGDYLAYGNLLWPEKMGGLLSINGSEPFGYCRWMSPASFLIRSREEQAQSGKEESLEAFVKARIEAEEAAKAGASDGGAGTQAGGILAANSGQDTEPEEAEETLAMKKEDLLTAAQEFDRKALAELKAMENKSGPEADQPAYSDVRTIVFRTEKGLSFKDYQFYGLDLNALREAADRIRTGEVTDLKVENGHVMCSVEGRRGQSVCFLVPWSKGWQAYRNGELVQPDTVAGTMITIPLVDGENNIELAYAIPYLWEGMIVSAGALAVLLLDMLCRGIASWRRKRKK